MKARTLGLLWLVVGLAVWNGFFDLYVSRGAREYLQLRAEADLGRGPDPSMSEVMNRSKHVGATTASMWTAAIVACGWATIAVSRRHPRA